MSPLNRGRPETISLKLPEGSRVMIRELMALPCLPDAMPDVVLLGLSALKSGWRPESAADAAFGQDSVSDLDPKKPTDAPRPS